MRRDRQGAGELFPEARPGGDRPAMHTDTSISPQLTSFLSEMTLFCLSRLFFEHLAQLVEKLGCRPPAGSGTGLRRRRRAGLCGARPASTARHRGSTAPAATERTRLPSTARHRGSTASAATGRARPPSTARHRGSMAAAAAGRVPPRPAQAQLRRCAAVEKAREGASGFASGSGAVCPPAVPHSGRSRQSVECGRRGVHKGPWLPVRVEWKRWRRAWRG